MKKTFILTTALMLAASVAAQTENAASVVPNDSTRIDSSAATQVDTLATKQIEEVVVKASKVIRKADMDVYHPDETAVKASKNGMQLLKNLMIPALSVSEELGFIKAAGEAVQVRINGRASSIEQVRALLPGTIKRVEWIDNPGLRYGNANYVLNFIVANPTAGGSFMGSTMQALNMAFGNYGATLKLNKGRSQWEISPSGKLTENLKSYRDYTETFKYADGRKLTRTESPLGGDLDNSYIYGRAAYNYTIPDTTVVMIDFNWYQIANNKFTYQGLLTMSDGSPSRRLTDISGDKGVTPSLSAYWQQNFAHRQMLVVDLSASLYMGRTYSDYTELYENATTPINDIHTNIKDRNQAYAVEADYIKNWNLARLTVGTSYTANRNRSQYESLDDQIFHQRQDRVYFFAEYFRRLGQFTVTAGMGAQYNSFKFIETKQGTGTWGWRPQATLTYAPNGNHNFRLSFRTWQNAPSLSQTNVVAQQIDGIRWREGNPNLKTSNSYRLDLRYGFNIPRVSGTFNIKAFSSPNAITPLIVWKDDRLVTTYENSRGFQQFVFSLSPQIAIVPQWVSMSFNINYTIERMRGQGYEHHNYGWNGSGSIMITHWGFTLSSYYQRASRDLWGEEISWGEDMNTLNLTYNTGNWQFGTGVLMAFGKYDQGSKLMNQWSQNERHMRLKMRMPYISVYYNIQWGHQKRGAQKLVNADASTDKSKAGGR